MPLSTFNKCLLVIASFFLVGFGQPAWLPWNGLFAAALGYALFWRVLLACSSWKKRAAIAFVWFFCVQLVQMSWFLSHPYWYIYTVYLFIATWLGLQFALIALLIRPAAFLSSSLLSAIGRSLFIAALWTLLEWSRLYLMSGLSWNPAGLALSSNLYALQFASLGGVFALSFWVMVVNLLALYAWMNIKTTPSLILLWITVTAAPYVYGYVKIELQKPPAFPQILTALLVQTAFAPEEIAHLSKKTTLVQHVLGEWRQILQIIKKHEGKAIDLIVLPEFVVPFGTYSSVYPLNAVVAVFDDLFGADSLKFLPQIEYPFATLQRTPQGPQLLVNNAYWMQAIANYSKADVIAGLEDAEEVSPGVVEYYSTAQFLHPQEIYPQENESDKILFSTRYAKRVLVPMGEYIPFSFCKKIAEKYGVFGSFTPGNKAIIMESHGIPFSPSICYEETYGNIISEGKREGARLLVNLTSDVWYPNSKLPQQHLDHARLRTVENGVPLIRACNTGITAAIDSFGRDIAVLGGDRPEEVEWIPDGLVVDVPIDTYSTLYGRFGDALIIGICLCIICGWLFGRLFLFKPH